MTDGIVLPPGAGRALRGVGMTLKVGLEQSARWSVFEANVSPGFDVGAHRHAETEEIFYILDGELDLLAFEPSARTSGDWTTWESGSGAKVVRGPEGYSRPTPDPRHVPSIFAEAVSRAGRCNLTVLQGRRG